MILRGNGFFEVIIKKGLRWVYIGLGYVLILVGVFLDDIMKFEMCGKWWLCKYKYRDWSGVEISLRIV